MKKFTITKTQVINAINSQPIGSKTDYATSKPFAAGTKLSAVGAVLRSLATTHTSAKKVLTNLKRDAFNAVARDNVNSIEALSGLETQYGAMLAAGSRVPKIRTQLAGWVKEYFPAKVQLTVWDPASVVQEEAA